MGFLFDCSQAKGGNSYYYKNPITQILAFKVKGVIVIKQARSPSCFQKRILDHTSLIKWISRTMVTRVIAYYFTYLFVTIFSSFWFLGGSDTGLEPLYFTNCYTQSIKIVKFFSQSSLLVKHTIYSVIQYTTICSTTIYSTPFNSIFFEGTHYITRGSTLNPPIINAT